MDVLVRGVPNLKAQRKNERKNQGRKEKQRDSEITGGIKMRGTE